MQSAYQTLDSNLIWLLHNYSKQGFEIKVDAYYVDARPFIAREKEMVYLKVNARTLGTPSISRPGSEPWMNLNADI